MAIQKRKKSNALIYWIIGGLGLFIILLVVAKSAGWIGKPKELEVELSKAKRATIIEKVSASGTVQPVTEVKLAPEVYGDISESLIEEGDSVKREQFLVKIREDIWVSQYQRAEASVNQQRANLVAAQAAEARSVATFTRADLEFKRNKKLW